jgi:DNA-binding NarL/FixJ family response regulator
MAEKTRVFIVDDHPLVRDGLANLINEASDLVVSGEAESVKSGLRAMLAAPPDVAIIDISLKDASGLELIRQLKAQLPGVDVIAFSMHEETLYAERAIRAGARGYVMKRESTGKIVDAIHRVRDGKLAISEAMATQLAQKFLDNPGGAAKTPLEQLSDRELEVFRLLGKGYETRRIADTLNVSIKTVQAYCVRIKQKLSLNSASELVFEAIRWQESSEGR